jgi:hypothetical protein
MKVEILATSLHVLQFVLNPESIERNLIPPNSGPELISLQTKP